MHRVSSVSPSSNPERCNKNFNDWLLEVVVQAQASLGNRATSRYVKGLRGGAVF
jgi:hypothetical protein